MPPGSKAALIRRIRLELDRVLGVEEVLQLLGADTVLARHGAAQREGRPDEAAMSVAATGSGWKIDRCTLPSPTCPQAEAKASQRVASRAPRP